MKVRLLMAACIALSSSSAALAQGAQSPATAPAVASAESYFVVFNRPGPNFGQVAQYREQAIAHRELYLRLAREGQLMFGGSFSGEPVLGLSVFRRGVDEAAIRRTLEDDALVQAGVLAIEFRRWTIQMGGIAPPPPQP